MDPKFEFETRAAVFSENLRTVSEFMQGFSENMPEIQAKFERMQQGDLFAMADWIRHFELNEALFADLAAVVRKYEHA